MRKGRRKGEADMDNESRPGGFCWRANGPIKKRHDPPRRPSEQPERTMQRHQDFPEAPDATRLMLVVCTGNICRSPMAAGLLAARLSAEGLHRWEVQSRGVHAVAGYPATEEAVRAVAELGLDIRAHRGRLITPQDIRDADLILTLESWHLEAIRSLVPGRPEKVQLLSHYRAERPDRDIADPYGRPYRFYVACRDEIHDAVQALVGHLKALEGPRPLRAQSP